MVNLVMDAFDKADEYRMPAMILADGMLGQMMEPVELPDRSDKPLPEKPWATNGHQGKRAHNVVNSLYLQAAELERLVDERFERYEKIKATEQRSESMYVEDADIVVVAYGAAARVCMSAIKDARAKGIKVGIVRPITLWPFPTDALKAAAKNAKAFLTVEMSKGQMVDDVRLAIECSRPVHFYGRTGGMIPQPAEVLREIEKIAGGIR